MNLTNHEWGALVLRLGLAALFLWFGFSQLLDGLNWVGWVPMWAVELLNIPPAMIVLGNGAFEVVAGGLLAFNILTRWAALALAVHLAVITVEIGMNEIGVRDFGLTMATLALVIFSWPKKTEELVARS
jgi:uncharacterized membrane protein YphA (DoxX/SURF4 family)